MAKTARMHSSAGKAVMHAQITVEQAELEPLGWAVRQPRLKEESSTRARTPGEGWPAHPEAVEVRAAEAAEAAQVTAASIGYLLGLFRPLPPHGPVVEAAAEAKVDSGEPEAALELAAQAASVFSSQHQDRMSSTISLSRLEAEQEVGEVTVR
jgi:hypothetical protein